MSSTKSDPLLALFAGILAFMQVALVLAAGFLLVVVPVIKAVGVDNDDWKVGVGQVGLEFPLRDRDSAMTVAPTVNTRWGPATLDVQAARATVKLPIGAAPWSVIAGWWIVGAVGLTLMSLAIRHTRAIVRRVREGAPFDAQNADRLRRVGFLLLGLSGLGALSDLVGGVLVMRGVTSGIDELTMRIQFRFLMVALVVIVLARIFRRGAELEHEQSLVV